MNPEQKELFRAAILRVLDANRTRWGLGLRALALHLGPFGFTEAQFADTDEFHAAIADALQYLCDKHLAEEALKVVSAANRAWRITTAGIDFLD